MHLKLIKIIQILVSLTIRNINANNIYFLFLYSISKDMRFDHTRHLNGLKPTRQDLNTVHFCII